MIEGRATVGSGMRDREQSEGRESRVGRHGGDEGGQTFREYARLLGGWLWLGFLGLGLWALILAGPALGWLGSGPRFVGGLIAVWMGSALILAEVSRRLLRTRRPLALLRGFVRLTSALGLVAILACVAWLVVVLVPEFQGSRVLDPVERVLGMTWFVLVDLADWLGVPDRLIGPATGPFLFLVLLVLVRNALHWRFEKFSLNQLRRGPRIPSPKTREAEDEGEEEGLSDALAAARRVAVSSYAEAKALLETTRMELTFLSLDIVGSTTMKEGEDPFVIEKSFTDYRKLVERALRKHEAYKQTWTPDGQMAAFRDPQAAVNCGQEILESLETFNAEVSGLKTDFSLRAGANVGVVSTDDEMPMEEMSDSSIDVAGHMQKYADPGTLWISEELFEKLRDSSGFQEADRAVDARNVYVWSPESSVKD